MNTSHSNTGSQRLRDRFFVKRTAWCLTRQAWIVLGLVAVSFGGWMIFCAGPFLCVSQPLKAEVLVVEGWLPDYALKGAAEEFLRGGYKYIVTAGSPLLSGYYVSGHKTSAHLAAETLIALGIPTNKVFAAPAPQVARGRSVAHAKAARDWLLQNDPGIQTFNVYSISAHARRTWLTFRGVCQTQHHVGIIAHPDQAFDINRWWTTSEGFRTVTGEFLAYGWMKIGGFR